MEATGSKSRFDNKSESRIESKPRGMSDTYLNLTVNTI